MSGYRRAPPGAVRGALREEDGDVGPDRARPLQKLRVAGRAARRLVGRPQRGRRVCAAAAQARACGARALEHSCMLSVAMEALTLIDVQSASLPANSTLQLRQGRRHGVVLRQLTRRAPCGTTLRRWTRKKRASPVRCLNRLSACQPALQEVHTGARFKQANLILASFTQASLMQASFIQASFIQGGRPSQAGGVRGDAEAARLDHKVAAIGGHAGHVAGQLVAPRARQRREVQRVAQVYHLRPRAHARAWCRAERGPAQRGPAQRELAWSYASRSSKENFTSSSVIPAASRRTWKRDARSW